MIIAPGISSIGFPGTGSVTNPSDENVGFDRPSQAVFEVCPDAPVGGHVDFTVSSGAVLDPVVFYDTMFGMDGLPCATVEDALAPFPEAPVLDILVDGLVVGSAAIPAATQGISRGTLAYIRAVPVVPQISSVTASFNTSVNVTLPIGSPLYVVRDTNPYLCFGETLVSLDPIGTFDIGVSNAYMEYTASRPEWNLGYLSQRYRILGGTVDPQNPPTITEEGTLRLRVNKSLDWTSEYTEYILPLTSSLESIANTASYGLGVYGFDLTVNVCSLPTPDPSYHSGSMELPLLASAYIHHPRSLNIRTSPKLVSGTFRFSVRGTEDVSEPIDIATCTTESIQSAIDAMPSIQGSIGITVQSLRKARQGLVTNTVYGYPMYSTGSNELLIQF